LRKPRVERRNCEVCGTQLLPEEEEVCDPCALEANETWEWGESWGDDPGEL
jgi:NMD protein affecting ribosome stability and mRNA decay